MLSQVDSDLIGKLFEMSGLTPDRVQQRLNELIYEAAKPTVLFWDIQDLERATSFKKTFLEQHLLLDPRIKQFERKHGPRGKRVWLCHSTAKAIEEIIMKEWE